MMKKRKRRGRFLICTGVILIAAALGLTGYNLYDDYRAAAAAESVVGRVSEYARQQKLDALEAENSQKEDQGDNLYFVDEEENLPDYVLDPYMKMPAVEVDGYRYIGTVTIPALEIELPIMEEWDYKRMRIAPCRYTGSAYLNDLVICGHNYRSHFGNLKNLQKNDEIIFTDANGNVFLYRVAQIETLSGTAVEEMITGDWDLTLFTCNYSGQARVTVRCVSVGK